MLAEPHVLARAFGFVHGVVQGLAEVRVGGDLARMHVRRGAGAVHRDAERSGAPCRRARREAKTEGERAACDRRHGGMAVSSVGGARCGVCQSYRPSSVPRMC